MLKLTPRSKHWLVDPLRELDAIRASTWIAQRVSAVSCSFKRGVWEKQFLWSCRKFPTADAQKVNQRLLIAREIGLALLGLLISMSTMLIWFKGNDRCRSSLSKGLTGHRWFHRPVLHVCTYCAFRAQDPAQWGSRLTTGCTFPKPLKVQHDSLWTLKKKKTVLTQVWLALRLGHNGLGSWVAGFAG